MSETPKPWTAKISPQKMAIHLVGDLLKKFKQLEQMPDDKAKGIAEGLIDGLKGLSIPYTGDSRIPDFLKSMEPDYCAGFQVGNTWRKVASEWPPDVSPEFSEDEIDEEDEKGYELANIKAILSDPNAVRLNMLRGTIAWTPETLRHVLGDAREDESDE